MIKAAMIHDTNNNTQYTKKSSSSRVRGVVAFRGMSEYGKQFEKATSLTNTRLVRLLQQASYIVTLTHYTNANTQRTTNLAIHDFTY